MLRSLDDLREYYDYSIIAVFKNNIIGNATAHPAEMVPKLLKVDQKKGGEDLKIWEISSVVLSPKRQGLRIWSRLFCLLQLDIVEKKFDAVIGGTINPKMKAIRWDHNYSFIPFPWDLYEQGLKHLWPKVGIEKFKREATCWLYCNAHVTPEQREGLLMTLSSNNLHEN